MNFQRKIESYNKRRTKCIRKFIKFKKKETQLNEKQKDKTFKKLCNTSDEKKLIIIMNCIARPFIKY